VGGPDLFVQLAEGQDGSAQFAEREFEAGLDRAERDAGVGGDLALGHAAVKGKPHRLLLGYRQVRNQARHGRCAVALSGLAVRTGMHVLAGRLGFLAEAILRSRVGHLAADAVDGAATDKGDNPAERVAFLDAVIFGAPPYFEEAFLFEIIDVVIVPDDSPDDRADQRVMAAMKGREGGFVASVNALHELFVGEVGDDRDGVFAVLLIE